MLITFTVSILKLNDSAVHRLKQMAQKRLQFLFVV